MENDNKKMKTCGCYAQKLDPQVYDFYREKIEKRAFFDPSIPLDVLRKGADSVFNDKNPVCDIAEWEERMISFSNISGSGPRSTAGRLRCKLKPEYAEYERFARPILSEKAPNLRVRIYWPKAKAECRDLPLVLYFHGGGFVLHNVESHDSLTRFIANEWNAVVISADYRLAPEHPYPGFLQDAWSLLWWAKDYALSLGADPGKVVLAGDSAGASIAAAISRLAAMCDLQSASDEETTCQSAIPGKRSACRAAGAEGLQDGCSGEVSANVASASRSENTDGGAAAGAEAPAQPVIWAQVLLYGAYGCVPDSASASVAEFGGGDYVLPKAMIDAFAAYVTPPTAPEDVPLGPGRGTQPGAEDVFFAPGKGGLPKGMPRSIVVVAGCDPLRDDGRGYARALEAAGADVTLLELKGMMHGFALYYHIFPKAAQQIRNIGSILDSQNQQFS